MAANAYADCFLNGVTPPCFTNVSFSGINNTLDTRVVFIATCSGCTHEAEQVVEPGRTYNLTANVPCDVASSEGLYNYIIFTQTPDQSTTNLISGVPSTNTVINAPTPTVYDPSNNGNGTNGNTSPILYTSTNAVTSQQQGDAALYDAVTKAAVQAHNDALAINSGVNGIYTNASAVAWANSMFLSNVLSHGLSVTGAIANVTVTNTGYGFTNYNLQGTQEGISNLLSGIATNIFANGTNQLTISALNTNANNIAGVLSNSLTGALAKMNAATNAASGVADAADQSAFLSGLSSSLSDEGGSPQLQNIDLGHGIVIALGSNIPAGFLPIRGIISWIVIALLLYRNFRTFNACVMKAFGVPQTTTAGTEVLGNNVNFFSALTMAGLIVATVSTLPVIAAGFLSSELAFWASSSNPLSVFRGGSLAWAYSLISQYVPIAVLFSAFCVRMVYVTVLESSTSVIAAILKFFVGV
jgi:hypothetical protein